MKFKFYITDLFDGCIKGTDDEGVARNFASCEDYFVLDTDSGTWLSSVAYKDLSIQNIESKS